MLKRNPLVSIIIATKNRVQYCIKSVESILAYTEIDFEVILQDNTDSTELKQYADQYFKDPRLVYRYTPPPFSSIDNFNAGLELAKGEYVCLIGDDDGICSNFFNVVRWAKANDIDSVCPKVFIDYYWPGAFDPEGPGYLTVPWFSGKVWEENPAQRLQPLVDDGIVNYMAYHLPKFYHGIVRRQFFEEHKLRTGYYLGGLSPDIYSAVTLSSVVKKHIVLDFPITISGACKVSTTVAGFNGGHSGQLKDAPHFRHRGNYVWDTRIPAYYSVQTIWAESALKAIEDNKIAVNLKRLNLYKIFAKSVLAAPAHYGLFQSELLKTINTNTVLVRLKLAMVVLSAFLLNFNQKVLWRIKALFIYRTIRTSPVDHIADATQIANDLLLKHDLKQILSQFSCSFPQIDAQRLDQNG